MITPVSIIAVASVSPLGTTSEEVWANYKTSDHFFTKQPFGKNVDFAAFLPKKLKEECEVLRNSTPHYKRLDDSVLFAILAGREAIKNSGWSTGTNIGVNIGSSRGATGLFEKYHQDFIENGTAQVQASPSTTLGNISSWVAQDLQSSGPEFSHSVTCSTGLHAVLNAVAWLYSGLAERFLIGGSEAPLTAFTIAQMKAMKIYATKDRDYPCQALNLEKKYNSMILGEAAALLALEVGKKENALAQITGIGYASEKLKHSVSISAEGESLQKAMKMAIGSRPFDEVDAVVMHAPGTIKGDLAEVNAIKAVFGEKVPALTSNKWKTGHTFGASGVLSMELAILMIRHQEFIPVPFSPISRKPGRLRNILVNAVGFGGNAVSVLISRN